MKPPKFIGLFPSQFPGFGGDEAPVFHHKQAQTKDGQYVQLAEKNTEACDMAFHTPRGTCISVRYSPVGVSAIDDRGKVWVLVQDYGLNDRNRAKNLRWMPFEVGWP